MNDLTNAHNEISLEIRCNFLIILCLMFINSRFSRSSFAYLLVFLNFVVVMTRNKKFNQKFIVVAKIETIVKTQRKKLKIETTKFTNQTKLKINCNKFVFSKKYVVETKHFFFSRIFSMTKISSTKCIEY